MRKIIFIVYVTLFFFCNSINAQEKLYSILSDNIWRNKFDYSDTAGFIYSGDIFKSNGKQAIIIEKITSFNAQLSYYKIEQSHLKLSYIDTIDIGVTLDIKFVRMNQDSFPDLYISTSDNFVWGYLYVYDSLQNIIKKVKNFSFFPNIQIIDLNSGVYLFSFKEMGCAGAKWQSNFIKIEGDEIENIGKMEGDDCEKMSILIKDMRDDEIYKTYPYSVIIEKYDEDIDVFIKAQWLRFLKDKVTPPLVRVCNPANVGLYPTLNKSK